MIMGAPCDLCVSPISKVFGLTAPRIKPQLSTSNTALYSLPAKEDLNQEKIAELLNINGKTHFVLGIWSLFK